MSSFSLHSVVTPMSIEKPISSVHVMTELTPNDVFFVYFMTNCYTCAENLTSLALTQHVFTLQPPIAHIFKSYTVNDV